MAHSFGEIYAKYEDVFNVTPKLVYHYWKKTMFFKPNAEMINSFLLIHLNLINILSS